MTLLKTVSLSAAALALLALPSLADDWHHGGRGGWHGGGGWRGGSRVSIGIGVVPSPYYYGPAYYGPRYYGPAYYEPAPVVVGREVGGGDVVADVQASLARKGYYIGGVDGAMGPRTRGAIRAWQADCGLAVTGTLNAATLRSLGLL